MNYNIAFNVPAKYLGSDVNKLISSLNGTDASKIIIPVNAVVSGSFNNPKVSTDLSKAVGNLTKQLVDQQKDKLKQQGEDKVKNALNDLLGGNKKEEEKTDTSATSKENTTNTQTQQTAEDKAKDAGKELINGLFKKKDKKEE